MPSSDGNGVPGGLIREACGQCDLATVEPGAATSPVLVRYAGARDSDAALHLLMLERFGEVIER